MWHLAWRNLTRRPGRSLLTMTITVLTVFSFVMALSIVFVLNDGLQKSSQRLGADIIILPNEAQADASQTLFTGVPVNVYMPSLVLDEAKAFAGVDMATPQFFSHTLEGSCCSLMETARLVGFDQESDFVLNPNLQKSETFHLKKDEVVVGSLVDIPEDGKIQILGETFHVARELLPTGSGMDETLFMDMETARNLVQSVPDLQSLWVEENPHDLISAVLIKADPDTDVDLLAAELDRKIKNVQAVAIGSTVRTLRNQVQIVSTVLLILWSSCLMIAVLALVGRYEAFVRDRRQEIGLLRALGVQRRQISRMVLYEALMLSCLGGAIGSVFAVLAVMPIFKAIADVFVLPTGIWSPTSAILCSAIGIGAAILLGFVAALRPALRSAKLDPQEAISKGALH